MFFYLRLLLLILLLGSLTPVNAEVRAAQKIIGPHYISLSFHSQDEFRAIINTGLILDERKSDNTVWAWATDEDLKYLENQNLPYTLAVSYTHLTLPTKRIV